MSAKTKREGKYGAAHHEVILPNCPPTEKMVETDKHVRKHKVAAHS